MKKKVVKLSESDLENLVQKIIKEDELNNIKEALPKRELERHQSNWRRGDFEPYKREDELNGSVMVIVSEQRQDEVSV